MAEEDIISTLPDVILCHILSFLQTKESVATSILSKRWNNLWRSVPSLNLGRISIADKNAYVSFLHFVNSFLLSLDPALPINNFILYFFPYYNRIPGPHNTLESITKWINIVIQRGVQYIDLCVDTLLKPYNLPVNILTCTTLVVLKIDNFIVEKSFPPVTLPSLKTLHLRDISFPQHRDFMLFLAGCPILENLFTNKVLFDSVVSLTCDDEWKSFSLTNLTTADIDGSRGHYRRHIYFPLQVIHNVSSLRLDIGEENYIGDFVPTFHYLTQLDFFCSSLNNNWKLVVKVLKHCPKLQKLRLKEAQTYNEFSWGDVDNDENWVDPDFVPQCLSLHLRTCSFKSCFGLHGTELMLAKYILKNANVLQTMKVKNTGETEIKGQLSSCSRASAICELTVYDVPE